MEETGVPGENHRPVASHWKTLSHNIVSSTPHPSRIWTHVVAIGTDCLGSYKSNYHTIKTRMAPCYIKTEDFKMYKKNEIYIV